MRKKNAGALFMDFEVSPEDRIGGASPRGRGKAKPAAKAKSRKPAKGERVEPGFGGFFTREQYDDEPAPKRGGRPDQQGNQQHHEGGVANQVKAHVTLCELQIVGKC